MEQQKFLDTFIYETMNGKFGVSDPTEFDQIIGIYDTKTEAENALIELLKSLKLNNYGTTNSSRVFDNSN